ncbi:hypothetical protein HK102_003051 [Quaeritorhiza haematococci]|nr:hypothetical protein HK102_003051 [Quaeritorhiza haematococci]
MTVVAVVEFFLHIQPFSKPATARVALSAATLPPSNPKQSQVEKEPDGTDQDTDQGTEQGTAKQPHPVLPRRVHIHLGAVERLPVHRLGDYFEDVVRWACRVHLNLNVENIQWTIPAEIRSVCATIDHWGLGQPVHVQPSRDMQYRYKLTPLNATRTLFDASVQYSRPMDIGSGLNFKRKGLKRLLERVMSGTVEEIVVTHKDRLCRFGFELIEFMVNKFGGRILVQNHAVRTPEEELTQDLLTIIHRKVCSATDCDEPIDPATNGYLCEAHYDPGASQCQGVAMTGRNKGQRCSYASSAGFCSHHAKKATKEKVKENENVTCRLYRLRPNKTQVKLLRQWFGVAREYYNATIEYLVKEKAKACFQDIRPIIKDKLDNAKPYRLQVPDKIRQGAIQDACQAMNNAKLKYQQNQVFSKLSFRTRRDPSQSIYLDKSAIKVEAEAVVFYPEITKAYLEEARSKDDKSEIDSEIRTTEAVEINRACRIVLKHNKYFQLASPRSQAVQQGPTYGECVALDPGGRSFLTLYSPDLCGHLSYEPRKRIEATYNEYDKV